VIGCWRDLHIRDGRRTIAENARFGGERIDGNLAARMPTRRDDSAFGTREHRDRAHVSVAANFLKSG